ncbi:hypothetical protein HELRODRAFT_91876, partial [Helobdella robusta]|uniref:Reverse transcriptase domain-containing protein n=1 Tax=Helobdella robusta TaxID=6412 RepID=T1G899_HELRO
FGEDGHALSLIRSYLSCRQQFVKLGNHTSSTCSIDTGVPQGSVHPWSNLVHYLCVSCQRHF